MTTVAGWCLDAAQYAALDQEAYAAHLHETCPRPGCACWCHLRAADPTSP